MLIISLEDKCSCGCHSAGNTKAGETGRHPLFKERPRQLSGIEWAAVHDGTHRFSVMKGIF